MRSLTPDGPHGLQPPTELSANTRILRPSRNCLAISSARRTSLLIDAADYFRTLDTVLRKARRSILIVGWDFDARTRLRPDQDGSPPLGELLRSLVEQRSELEIRILVWDLSTIHAPGEALPLIFGAEWQEHPRIQLWLDHNHPIYGAQHQKLVCIDDSVAFAGGIDLTIDRWDTSLHMQEDARRRKPDGTAYGPVHDLQIVVEGESAQTVTSVAHHRWRQATGETLTLGGDKRGLWPPDLKPDFADVPIAVSRTIPASGGDPEVREIRLLIHDALTAAEESIYIEAQYFADPGIGDILAAGLAKEKGPEIVTVVAHSDHGLLEKLVMGANRDRMIRRLRQSDRYDRFRALYPVITAPGGVCEIFIHSKLLVVDNRFLRIGSANLNRRSTGLDTECDLSIEASDAETRAGISRIRTRLLAEHLGASPEEVRSEVESLDSLVRAIDQLAGRERTLHPFNDIKDKGSTRPLPGTRLLDPSKPLPLMSLFRRRRPRRHIQRA